MKLTFLGTGTSQGIPLIGCFCPVCTSSDPRDTRYRTSAMIHYGDKNILIDAAPELRIQCIKEKIDHLNACLVTHAHADHIFGMDDLRTFNYLQQCSIPIFAQDEHLAVLDRIFSYGRQHETKRVNYDLPQFDFQSITPGNPFDLFGLEIIPFKLPHGGSFVSAYRIGPLAYCTDISDMPDEVIDQLKGIDTLIIGALCPKPHPRHLSTYQAIELSQKIKPRQTYFTHMSHKICHQDVEATLPDGIFLAHDNLTISIHF